ncbi:MAG: leucine-rich repeat domain-containing protein [Clostridia bacterium]|nr:leucine-rich repeat domain-containing protein [Clostridia bacterium]
MKLKTKLIASIMSICLVCAVFAIGVFALKTANLKIGGDVSFQATGVEATIAKYSVTANAVANETNHFQTVTIDTSKTQEQIDSTVEANSWTGLDVTLDESGMAELVVAITNNAGTATNNYIEVDYEIDLGTANNAKITMSPKTVGEHISDYIIEPKETDYYVIKFKVRDVEVDASMEDFTFQIVLNHIAPVALEIDGSTNYYYQDVLYSLNKSKLTATVNYYRNSPTSIEIPAVVTDGTDNYIVTSISNVAFSNCSTLASIGIPRSITWVGNETFKDTAWYNNQEDGLIYVGTAVMTYKGEMPENTKIELREDTSYIADYAFYEQIGLTAINIPDNLLEISMFSFNGCTGLRSIIIPENVTLINNGAFEGCENLESVTFKISTGWMAIDANSLETIALDLSDPVQNAVYLKTGQYYHFERAN